MPPSIIGSFGNLKIQQVSLWWMACEPIQVPFHSVGITAKKCQLITIIMIDTSLGIFAHRLLQDLPGFVETVEPYEPLYQIALRSSVVRTDAHRLAALFE